MMPANMLIALSKMTDLADSYIQTIDTEGVVGPGVLEDICLDVIEARKVLDSEIEKADAFSVVQKAYFKNL